MLTRVWLLMLCVTTAVGQNTADGSQRSEGRYPRIVHAELPLYPPAAWSAHLGGTVEINVTVDKGAVVHAQVKRGTVATQGAGKGGVRAESKLVSYLSLPSVANVKTWQFDPEPGGRTTFSVVYVYRIEGDQTPLPENPKIELELPRLVRVTVRPFKPSSSSAIRR